MASLPAHAGPNQYNLVVIIAIGLQFARASCLVRSVNQITICIVNKQTFRKRLSIKSIKFKVENSNWNF